MRALASAAAMLAALMLGAPAPGFAQEAGGSWAAAYAPEAALEICRGDSVPEAAACARTACAKASGFEPEYCVILAACETGNWAGVMGVMLEEVHFSTAICGSPSRDGLVAEFRARCAAYGEFGMRECFLSRLYPPQGEPEEAETMWSRTDLGLD